MKKLLFILAVAISSANLFALPERIYIDSKELDRTDDRFRIHLGHNVWVESNAMYRDETGMYTMKSNLKSAGVAYEKTWKCPYCYRYYPVGTSCKNSECPSKYR